jgi:signal transduction histidine kinase
MAELERKLQKMAGLIEVGKALSSEIDFDKLLKLIAEKANEVVDSERCTLFLVDETKQYLVSRVATTNELKEIRVPITKGVVGHVVETGQLLNIPDAYSDPHFNPEVDRETGYTTRCLLAVPLRNSSGEIIGVFQALNKKDGGTFDHDDEEMLLAMASQAAVALENSLLIAARIESERLALVGQTASGLVHDVKNSLTSIYGFAQVLLRRFKEGPEANFARIIFDETQKVLMMLENLLAFTRNQKFEPRLQRVSLSQFIDKDVLLPLSRDLEDLQVEVTTEYGFDGEIDIDPLGMRRALANLVINAKEAMPRGGKLHISTARRGEDCIEIRVSDTGRGIPPELFGAIFKPFKSFQKKGGTGLGLHNTREIAQAHGGSIEVESQVNQGTTFCIVLPLRR